MVRQAHHEVRGMFQLILSLSKDEANSDTRHSDEAP